MKTIKFLLMASLITFGASASKQNNVAYSGIDTTKNSPQPYVKVIQHPQGNTNPVMQPQQGIANPVMQPQQGHTYTGMQPQQGHTYTGMQPQQGHTFTGMQPQPVQYNPAMHTQQGRTNQVMQPQPGQYNPGMPAQLGQYNPGMPAQLGNTFTGMQPQPGQYNPGNQPQTNIPTMPYNQTNTLTMQEVNAMIQQSMQGYTSLINRLHSEIEGLKKTNDGIVKENQELKEKVQSIEQANIDIIVALNKLTENNEYFIPFYKTHKDIRSEYKQAIEDAKNEVKRENARAIEDAKKEVREENRQAINDLGSDLRPRMMNSEERIGKLTTAVNGLVSDHTKLNNYAHEEVKKLDDRIKIHSDDMYTFRDVIAASRRNNDEMRKELENYKQRLEECHKGIEYLETDVIEINRQIRKIDGKIEGTGFEIAADDIIELNPDIEIIPMNVESIEEQKEEMTETGLSGDYSTYTQPLQQTTPTHVDSREEHQEEMRGYEPTTYDSYASTFEPTPGSEEFE